MRTVLRFGVMGRLLGAVGVLAAVELVPYKWFKWLMLSVTITLQNVEQSNNTGVSFSLLSNTMSSCWLWSAGFLDQGSCLGFCCTLNFSSSFSL